MRVNIETLHVSTFLFLNTAAVVGLLDRSRKDPAYDALAFDVALATLVSPPYIRPMALATAHLDHFARNPRRSGPALFGGGPQAVRGSGASAHHGNHRCNLVHNTTEAALRPVYGNRSCAHGI